MYFFQSDYYRYLHISVFDFIFVPLIFAIILIWAYMYKRKKENEQPMYKYFHFGLAAKMISAFLFCLAYMLFYEGDTLDYFNGTVALNHVLFKNPSDYFQLMLHGNKPEFLSFFTSDTGYPEGHMFRDPKTFFVIRLFSPL